MLFYGRQSNVTNVRPKSPKLVALPIKNNIVEYYLLGIVHVFLLVAVYSGLMASCASIEQCNFTGGRLSSLAIVVLLT